MAAGDSANLRDMLRETIASVKEFQNERYLTPDCGPI
jgi:hypothetical protein